MGDYDDLLTLEDPFLPRVRAAAVRHEAAFNWFVASVTHWARGEFVRRVDIEEMPEEKLDRRMWELRGRQIAALTTHLDLGGNAPPHRRGHWTVHVGALPETGTQSTHEYLRLDLASGELAGMFDVMDVFELPPEWCIEPWPNFRPEPPPPKAPDAARPVFLPPPDGDLTDIGAELSSPRARAARQALLQAKQVTTVTYDRRTGAYDIGHGALKVYRAELLSGSDAEYEAVLTRLWAACGQAEVDRRIRAKTGRGLGGKR